jgi:cytochrome c556
MMTKMLLSLSVAALAAVSMPAQAQFAKPEDAYKYRASVMFLQSQHMGRINAQLRSEKPNLSLVAENAAVLDTVNKLFFTSFPEGSDMVSSSRAKPEIWKEPAKFKQHAERLNGEVAKLLASSKAGDLAATRTSFQATAQVCKACHDDFRRD